MCRHDERFPSPTQGGVWRQSVVSYMLVCVGTQHTVCVVSLSLINTLSPPILGILDILDTLLGWTTGGDRGGKGTHTTRTTQHVSKHRYMKWASAYIHIEIISRPLMA